MWNAQSETAQCEGYLYFPANLQFNQVSYSISISSSRARSPLFECLDIRVYFARDYIFFKGPNNVIGLYWRLKFEWEQLLWFFLGSCRVLVYVFFFQTCMARVFSNRHNSHNKHIKFKKFGGKIAQLLCLDLYKYKISRQIDSKYYMSRKRSIFEHGIVVKEAS